MAELGEITNTLYQILAKVIQYSYSTPTDEQVKAVVDQMMEVYEKEKPLYKRILDNFRNREEKVA